MPGKAGSPQCGGGLRAPALTVGPEFASESGHALAVLCEGLKWGPGVEGRFRLGRIWLGGTLAWAFSGQDSREG